MHTLNIPCESHGKLAFFIALHRLQKASSITEIICRLIKVVNKYKATLFTAIFNLNKESFIVGIQARIQNYMWI